MQQLQLAKVLLSTIQEVHKNKPRILLQYTLALVFIYEGHKRKQFPFSFQPDFTSITVWLKMKTWIYHLKWCLHTAWLFCLEVNTLRPRQNGRHFADDTFKYIFLNENVIISAKISLKFVPKGPINNITSLVEILDWRRPGDKPLSEPMMVR